MDDGEIVERYLSRDESAIAQTAQKYGPQLRGIANRILHDPGASEECENDTYLQAWQRIPPHAPRTYLFAFLGRITRNLAIDRCRRQSAQKRQAVFCALTEEMAQCLPSSGDVEEDVDRNALTQTINTFLSGCSEERRNVFVRRYWFFDSIPEISRRYGFSESKVKTVLFRMRNDLRRYLEEEGYTI